MILTDGGPEGYNLRKSNSIIMEKKELKEKTPL